MPSFPIVHSIIVTGSSPASFAEAARNAVASAQPGFHGKMLSFLVANETGTISGSTITEFTVTLNITVQTGVGSL
jgi:flavin-binding protein dodecin